MQYTVDIDITLRPIRLAHLVNPRNRQQILDAIEINTCLWGGTFNPIIPTYGRLPRNLKDFSGQTNESLVEGYLYAFDPDFVVVHDSAIEFAKKLDDVATVPASEILDFLERKLVPTYGIGAFEIFKSLEQEELRYVSRQPLEIIHPVLTGKYKLFLASVLGYMSPKQNAMFKTNILDKLPMVKEEKYSHTNYFEGLTKQTTRKITSFYKTKDYRLINNLREGHLFYMDANNTQDILDCWNLRASGLYVFPICKQFADSTELQENAEKFIRHYYHPSQYNAKIFHQPTFLKSRMTPKSEFEKVATEYAKLSVNESGETMLIPQDFYPPMWDRWSVRQKQVSIRTLKSDFRSEELHSLEDRVAFNFLAPNFVLGSGGNISPRYANDIRFSVYSNEELFAEVLPEGRDEYADEFGFFKRFNDFRFSKKGLVKFGDFRDKSSFRLPSAEKVMLRWLSSSGWEAELSSSGRIAKQMLKQLSGKTGINILALDGVVTLLSEFSGEKTAKEEQLKESLSRIGKATGYEAKFLLQRLTEVSMFRLGIVLQCPICTQHSWFSIKDADYRVQCGKCLEQFLIPSHSPKEIKWSYRTFGSFSLPQQAYGAYAVLLTFRFFSSVFDGATTPLFSFIAKKDSQEIEADLALFFQKSQEEWNNSETRVVFAECKTFNSFERKDVKRMDVLRKEFPGCMLVFATLKKELSMREKALLRGLVDRSRRQQTAGKPFSPILILTGHELLTSYPPPGCWAEISEISESLKMRHSTSFDLVHLCDATQQIHL